MSSSQNPDQQQTTPEWLDRLQNESWQAEILISGGAFVVLGTVDEAFVPLFQFLFYSTSFPELLINGLSRAVSIISWSLMFGFLIHLVLRGFWVGLVGMNYVFPNGIDKDKLAMKGKFREMFREAKNTTLLIRLDKYCGAVFAITFVWLFSSVGGVIYLLGFVLLDDIAHTYPWVHILAVFMALIGVIIFIDFLSAGRLKRIKWLALFYYPFHRIISVITLSFIYRRLYYTIVSNMAWKYVIALFSIPFLLIYAMLIMSSINTSLSDSFRDMRGGYENPANEPFLVIKDQIIKDNSLDVKITHITRLEQPVFEQWKKKNPHSPATNLGDLDDKLQKTMLSNLYELQIDEKNVGDSSNWLLTETRTSIFPRIELVTVLDISDLAEGPHQLTATIKLDSMIVLNQNVFKGRYAKVNFFFHKPRSDNSRP